MAQRISGRSSSTTGTNNALAGICYSLSKGEMIISRTTFIVVLTVCVFITLASFLGLVAFAYREWARQRQEQQARAWGKRQPPLRLNRITLMRKAIDDEYSRQFSGCLSHSLVENPFLAVDEPVELMHEERLCEAPAVPAKVWSESNSTALNAKRKTQQRMSLWFDSAKGLWVPKK